MSRPGCLLASLLLLGTNAALRAEDKKAPPDGVYAVLRDSLTEKDVLPVKDGERLIVHRHRYLKDGDKEPPRYLIVRAAPDVTLDLDGEPKAVKEGDELVSIRLKLKAKQAAALEKLTRDQLRKQVAIVLGGEVATMHKVREVIKGGEVQVSSCVPKAAEYLLKRLKEHAGKGAAGR